MADLHTLALPLLPLPNGVVLPQMVVTLALESPEARAAADAALEAEGLILLVPKVGNRYARVGTVAKIENSGELPTGGRGVILRGLHRANVGIGVPGSGTATWVQVEPVEDGEITDRVRELARELRAVLEGVARHRGGRPLVEMVREITDPGALADSSGYWPDLDLDQKVEVLETTDLESRLDKVLGWARDSLRELELSERIRTDVTEGMEKQQRDFLLRQQLA